MATASKAHAKTNNTHIPKEGVRVRAGGRAGRLHDKGAFYKVDFDNGQEAHVPKSNFSHPPNLGKVTEHAIGNLK